jgi:ankyrin repeat protein
MNAEMLMNAIVEGNMIEALKAICHDKSLIHSTHMEATPLTTACLYGREDFAKILLQKGAKWNINMPSPDNTYSRVETLREYCIRELPTLVAMLC